MVKKDFGADLSEAARVYALAMKGERSGVTLRCKNMGFPPPLKYQPAGEDRPLELLNEKGIWWCPYCMKLRRFKKVNGFKVDDIDVGIPGMACPMCGVNHRDFHVRKWNPLAMAITDRGNDPNPRRARRNRRVAREGR